MKIITSNTLIGEVLRMSDKSAQILMNLCSSWMVKKKYISFSKLSVGTYIIKKVTFINNFTNNSGKILVGH